MTCSYCGTILPATALFCGECGRSLAHSTGRTAPVAVRPAREPALFAAPMELDAATVMSRSKPVPIVELVDTVDEREPSPVAPVVTVEEPQVAPPRDPWTPPARLLGVPVIEDDVEKTRIVSSTASGTRFVLQFSTGESVTVVGTGLIGRNPVREPAEYFDHLVTIVDPGKSVSKTHLEFGQAGGAFWVTDRFSGNGTVIREPDSDPRRCDPGKRYRIVRGTRVTMGEQFFVVS